MDNISVIQDLFSKLTNSPKFKYDKEAISELEELKLSILNIFLNKNRCIHDIFENIQPKIYTT